MPTYTGAVHIHSRFSDGALALEQIAALARRQGLQFVVCGEHAQQMDAAHLRSLMQTCRDLSTDGLLVVPGLEFEWAGRHILAIGPDDLLCGLDARTVAEAPERVRSAGGLTVWAHPALTFAWSLRRPMRLDYDGWEIWNGRVDGLRPCGPIAAALRRRQRRGGDTVGLAGTDFHSGEVIPPPLVEVDVSGELTRGVLLEALRQGRFRIGIQSEGQLRDGSGGWNPWSASLLRYVLLRTRCVLALARYRCISALRPPRQE